MVIIREGRQLSTWSTAMKEIGHSAARWYVKLQQYDTGVGMCMVMQAWSAQFGP